MRLIVPLLLASAVAAGAQTRQPSAPQQPARDISAQQKADEPSGVIAGRVVAADSGRPVKRARVFVTAPELSDGRAALTAEDGTYSIEGLPAGRYTVGVSKTGFVSLSWGQRRPLQPGTPVQLNDKQALKGVDFRLPRGGVIAGRLVDEDGDALPGATVRAMEYRYLQGERRLVNAGTAQTDDRGEFRVWGLMPGTYYVSATARNFGRGFGGFGGFGRPAANGGENDEDAVAYAPTYFPGVGTVNEARAIAVGISQEVLDVNFGLQLVHTSRLTGKVTNPDGTAVTAGNVALTPESGAVMRGGPGLNFGARIQWDGAFAISNVPPGRYVLRARATDSDDPLFAIQPIAVNGDMSDLIVIVAPGASIAGVVAFDQSQTHVDGVDPTSIRITAMPADAGPPGPTPSARAGKDGTFTLNGVPAGAHYLRTSGVPRGWMLQSVTVAGRDVTDIPIELRSAAKTTGVRLVFTDRVTELNGTVADAHNTPVTEFTVLAFPTDASLWRPQARQIMTARPDQNGKYVIRGLPPGEYYVATVDPAEQGEWFEPSFLDQHRAGAARITIGDGATKTQDFQVER